MSVCPARERALEIADRIESLGAVSVKRFFGGASLVLDGVQFGFVMKGSLYLRVDNTSRTAFEALGGTPFTYAGGSKTVTVASYYEAPDAILEDAEQLHHWAATAHRAARMARRDGRKRRTIEKQRQPPDAAGKLKDGVA